MLSEDAPEGELAHCRVNVHLHICANMKGWERARERDMWESNTWIAEFEWHWCSLKIMSWFFKHYWQFIERISLKPNLKATAFKFRPKSIWSVSNTMLQLWCLITPLTSNPLEPHVQDAKSKELISKNDVRLHHAERFLEKFRKYDKQGAIKAVTEERRAEEERGEQITGRLANKKQEVLSWKRCK